MTREHTALTAAAEKRILLWMARRIPAFINADHLTALAFVSQLLAALAYAQAALWAVNVCLFLNWFGDSLDGTLARFRNQQRPRYGFYVNHMADTIGALALMSGLACSGYLHWPIAAGMLICFYVLSIESYLAAYSLGRFHISHGLFGPTEIRILLIAANLWIAWRPYVLIAGRKFLLLDIGGAIAIAGMTIMALGPIIQHTRTLYRQEPAR